ncbi:MAG: hypothetical protein IH946_08910, partial [Bacteroidetes bacterium]|nr:hypothetical protein [Bacteroidota bacterium]
MEGKFSTGFWIKLFLVAVVTFSVLSPSLKNGFTNWDDTAYITDNNDLREFSLKRIFTENVLGNYHPLTMLTYNVDYQLFGFDPFYYHLDNLVLHSINAGLVFALLFILLGSWWGALIGALLFGVHPMHVESVSWISERKDLLYTMFFVTGLICYLKYQRNQGIWFKDPFYLLALILFLLSLLSKALAVSFPLVLLLLDYIKRREWGKVMWMDKIPFFVLSLLFGVIALVAQSESGSIQTYENYSFIDSFLISCYGLLAYIYKFFIPLQLSNLY